MFGDNDPILALCLRGGYCLPYKQIAMITLLGGAAYRPYKNFQNSPLPCLNLGADPNLKNAIWAIGTPFFFLLCGEMLPSALRPQVGPMRNPTIGTPTYPESFAKKSLLIFKKKIGNFHIIQPFWIWGNFDFAIKVLINGASYPPYVDQISLE